MKDLARVVAVLICGLLGACGGGDKMASSNAAAPADPALTLDVASWDGGAWAE